MLALKASKRLVGARNIGVARNHGACGNGCERDNQPRAVALDHVSKFVEIGVYRGRINKTQMVVPSPPGIRIKGAASVHSIIAHVEFRQPAERIVDRVLQL